MEKKKIRISCDVHSEINFGFTHRIASNPHFAVGATIIRRHLQFDIEFALCQINLWCDFAAAQIYDHGGRLVAAELLTWLVQVQVQVLVREPVPFVAFQCEFLRFQKAQVVGQLGYLCDIVASIVSIWSFALELQFAESRIDVICFGTVLQARCIDARIRLLNFILKTDLELWTTKNIPNWLKKESYLSVFCVTYLQSGKHQHFLLGAIDLLI